MTLANIVSTGSGRLAARWEIEGLPVEFVTDPGMEQTLADGRVRLCCTSLADCGFTIEESVNLPEALLEAQGTGLTLWETLDEDLSAVFHFQPSLQRFGSTGITDSATTLAGLYSTTGITAGDVLHLGTEAVKVASVDSDTQITFSNRAYWGTVAQYHYSADTSGHPSLLITDRPLRIRGRQVRLWLYGDGDDLQGNGSLRWLGRVKAEPVLVASGTQYRLALGPVTECLKTKIGGDLDTPVRPRGIYYPSTAALRIQIFEYSPTLKVPFGHFTGFHEDQIEFCAALTTWLASFASDNSLDSTYEAEPTLDGRWTIKVTIGSSTTSAVPWVMSEQDGMTIFPPRLADMRIDAPDGLFVGEGGSVSPGDELYPDWLDTSTRETGHRQRTVPRGYWGLSGDDRLHYGAAEATAPHDRIYVDRDVDDTWASVAIAWPGGLDGLHIVITRDATENWLQLNRFEWAASAWLGEGVPVGIPYTASTMPEIRPLRTIATGDLADFRNALIVEAIEFGNLGTAPFVTERDVATWTGPVGRAAVYAWQRERIYAFASSADFEDVLSQECRMLGLFPITDSNGKIALTDLSLPSGTTTTTFDIDEEIVTIDGMAQELSYMARGNQTVNRVKFWIGYNPRSDEWSNWREVQDRTSYALDHQDRLLEIKPRSYARVSLSAPDPEEVGNVFLPILALFGYPHEFVTVKVTWKAFDVRLGDAVTFSADHLPSYTQGRRPINSIKGLVTGRKWALGEAHGELTVLISWINVAGYAPSALVSSQANVAGNIWDLTIDTSVFFASGEDCTDHFVDTPKGDRVRIVQVDSESATTVLGTVVTVSATTIRVSFDGTWTPGSDAWVLQFASYSEVVASGNASQLQYAYLAGPDLLLGPSDAEPRTLAP